MAFQDRDIDLMRWGQPRNNARSYRADVFLSKEEFDNKCKEDEFSDGPHREIFGDGYGDPYNPYRQAFGTLKDGRRVFCELNPDVREMLQARNNLLKEEK